MARPPADRLEIVRLLIRRGPLPTVAIREAARDGELPFAESSIRVFLRDLIEEGWLRQHTDRGDYYPTLDPDTGAALRVEVLRPGEWELVRAAREAA